MTYETYEEIKFEIKYNTKIIKKFYENNKKDLDRNSREYFELYVTTLVCLAAQEERLRYQIYEVMQDEDAMKKWCENDFERHYDTYIEYNKEVDNPNNYSKNLNEFEYFALDWQDKMQYKKETKNKIGYY